MFKHSVLKNNKGGGMVIGFFALLIILAFGISFLTMSMSSLTVAKADYQRARALELAEAGVERAISLLKGTAPDGTTNGSWRTIHPSTNPDNHNGDTWYTETISPGESFKVCVRTAGGGDSTKIVITSVGTATYGSSATSRTLKVLIERKAENVNPWSNVIFGGVGQAGKSINGNVRMRGSVHLLGDGEKYTDIDGDKHWDDNETYTDENFNGQYDIGETYTDVDGDGHRDAREPFIDVNGNGTRDPALTVTDIATETGGTADVGNNYDGMPVNLQNKLPSLPTKTFGGETVSSLSAKLRVKHGRVNISGSAVVGYPNASGNGIKETMDGTYVSDGYGGNAGTVAVHSDNGYTHGYDLGDDLVQFPSLMDPYPPYPSYKAYLALNSLSIPGSLAIGDTSFNVSNLFGSISYDSTTGLLKTTGIVMINGDLEINGKGGTLIYEGDGTLFSTDDANIHCNVLPKTGFPLTDRLGIIAAHDMGIATGSGDSQLTMALAMYAQYRIDIGKQCEIAGTCVTSFFSMKNVPHIYQVPKLSDNLPPGLPGSKPIWIVTITIKSWQDLGGS
ncbi:MAG: hypothetical protein ABFD64_12435 [Armatimonadota bacterium]